MTAIGVYEAKTQLPKLLARVGRGERFLITRRGRPVAQLVPAVPQAAADLKAIIQQMQDWQEREGPTLGPGLTIRDLRDEGRRSPRDAVGGPKELLVSVSRRDARWQKGEANESRRNSSWIRTTRP
jgi:prevent-host-death family protein